MNGFPVVGSLTVVFALLPLTGSTIHAQRVQTSSVPGPVPSIVIEGESLVRTATASDGGLSTQDMSGFGAGWSNRGQLFWRAPSPADGSARNWPRLNLSVAVPQAGEYLLSIRHTQAPDYGDVRVFVRGAAVGDFAGFGPRVAVARTQLGRVTLAQGPNPLTLTVFRRAAGSRGSFVGIDAIELIPIRQPDPAAATGSVRAGGATILDVAGTVNVNPVPPPGAKLYRFWHQNLDAPPSWTDTGAMELGFHGGTTATAQFKWDVSSVPNAKAIAYQVTSSAFGPYTIGEPMQSPAYIAVGYRAGTTGQLDIELPLTPPKAIPPANTAGMMADYQVRILPILAPGTTQVVGAASNAIVVKTYKSSAPGMDIKITPVTFSSPVKVVKFTWVPYKYTAHWPPGCKPIPIGGAQKKSEAEVVAGALGDAWSWATKAYEDAKGFVVTTVVDAIALIPPGIEIPQAWVATALDGALMAAGVPPNIPNLDKLMTDGAGFLAQQLVEQIPIPPSVTNGLVGDLAIQQATDIFKSNVQKQAKNAILNGAKKAKAAADSQSEYCLGLYDYEYINITMRNEGTTVQKNVDVLVGDGIQAFKGLNFKIPSIAPGEELVVPRYLYSPEHLNLPHVAKSQLVSENLSESWTLWNQKYNNQSFVFGVSVLAKYCAGGCLTQPVNQFTTPSRYWGKEHAKAFSWP
jgi:hypothetical protein